MGNSASEIISKVSSASSAEIQKLISQDIELLQDTSVVFSTTKLALRSDLANYSVPGGEEKKEKKDPITTDDEQSLMCSQDLPANAKERREQAITNLMLNISRNAETDIASAEVTKRLQAFCRIFEAVLRSDEIKKRKNNLQLKVDDQDFKLPASAKSAIKFGLSTLLNLVECVAALNPIIYELVVNDANKILTEIGPLSMVTSDSTLSQAFNDVANFFEKVISGYLTTITPQATLHSFGPLFRLGLATGSLPILIRFSSSLLSLTNPDNDLLINLYQPLQQLNKLLPRYNFIAWDKNKKGAKITLSEDNLTATSTVAEVGNVFSTFVAVSERFYFEIIVNKSNDNSYFGICDANYSNTSAFNDSNFFSVSYQATSNVFLKSNSQFNFEPWKQGDKIGAFIDMPNKKVAFYKNGVKQPGPEQVITSDRVQIYASQSGETELKLNTIIEYPADIKELLGVAEIPPFQLDALLSSEEPPPEYLSITPGEITGYILKKLLELSTPIEYLLNSKSYHFDSLKPVLGLELSNKTIENLYNLQKQLISILKSKDFSRISEATVLASITNVQKVIRYHLTLSKDIESLDIDPSIKKSILDLTVDIINTFPDSAQTQEASSIISSCFEVFYKQPSDKLHYIVESLERFMTKGDVLPVFKEMESEIYAEMARADKVFPAIDLVKDEDTLTLKKFYGLLIDISTDISKQIISNQKPNTSIIKLLQTTQTAILAQAGKVLFQDKWKEIILDYSKHFLNSSIEVIRYTNDLYKNGAVPDAVINNIEQTIISKILNELLSSLVLSPMELALISEILPLADVIAKELSKISAVPAALSLGIGIVEDLYESPHNYLDNSQLKHTIKIPNAVKYTLTFDPQCKTENGCDYLELWLDEAATNKFARWEGEAFPKEPVEVINPILHFTFRSDGSVNYWGWKITIKASVECSFYQKQWPDTTKDTTELFFGFCASKLISGKFEATQTPDDVKKIFENPLLKYGISDKSTLLSKPLPPINPYLQKIIDSNLEVSGEGNSLSKFYISPDYKTDLNAYLEHYKTLTTPHYSDSLFLVDLFEGKQSVVDAWLDLKKKSGAYAGSSIGGNDLDQAERAVFAVYVEYFEVIDTVSEIFASKAQPGATVKLFVKQSIQIRAWAQKHKQKLLDGGNAEITYKIINDDIVKKCAFLLGADYKLSLKELGITKVLKNLIPSIAKIQEKKSGLKVGSKWKAVQNAVQNVHKLKSLSNIRKKPAERDNEDTKEFIRVADLVTGFLENPITIDQITEAIESKRTRAIARVIGLLSISRILNFSSEGHETFIVRSFVNSFKDGEKKLYYTDGLEGTDPKLIESVQKAFFIAFRSLQKDLINYHNEEFSYETYSHFSQVIEGLSCPLKNLDTHVLLDQPLSSTLKVLLDWSKGSIREKPTIRTFVKENCITRFGLLTEDAVPEGKPKILIEKREEQPSLYLTFDKNGNEAPITEFIISEEQKEGFEDAVGEFTHNNIKKWIYIKRSDPNPLLKYLTDVSEDLVPKFSTYSEMLSPVNEEEKKKIASLKEGLCRKSWSLFKQLLFSVLGAWHESNQTQQLQVQDLFLKVLIPEIAGTFKDLDTLPLNLKFLSTGEEWLGKNLVFPDRPTHMQAWVSKFFEEKPPTQLKNFINNYIEYVDNLQTGETEVNSLGIQEKISNYKNDAGLYDFFVYIDHLKESEELSNESKEYISNSPLWKDPKKEIPYQDPLEIPSVISKLIENFAPTEENSFSAYIDLFKDSNGLIPKEKLPETTPADFKTEDGNLDLFITLRVIKDNPGYAHFYSQISTFYTLYPSLPSSVSQIDAINLSKQKYIGSLIWNLYGGFTSQSLSNILSKDAYLTPFLKYAFTSSAPALQTISSRLLARIIPSQHSPQSFSHIWDSFTPNLAVEDRIDLISLLLKRIGKISTVSENFSIGYESQYLLLSLLNSDRWRQEVLDKIKEALNEAVEYISTKKTIKSLHAGVIKLLSLSDGFGISPFVLAVVGLQESNYSNGVIKEVVDEKTFNVYSVIDDTTSKVDIKNIISIESPGGLNILNLLKDSKADVCNLLIEVWTSIYNESNDSSHLSLEASVTIKTLYLSLESSALNGISNLLNSLDIVISDEKLLNIASILLSRNKKYNSINRTVYNKVTKEIFKKINEIFNEPEEFNLEEIKEKVNQMPEEDKTKFNEATDKGLGTLWVYKCFTKGVKDLEAIANYVEDVTPNLIYKLGPIEESSLSIRDVHGSAEIYQNNLYHLIISDNTQSHKSIKFSLPKNIFHSVKYFCPEITIRVVLDRQALDNETDITFTIGSLVVNFLNSNVLVSGNHVGEINTNDPIVLRIHSKSNGSNLLLIENTNLEVPYSSNSIFTGVSISDVSLSLDKGSQAILGLIEVYDGKFSTNFTGKIEKSKRLEGGERSVKIKKKSENPDKCRLKLLGLDDEKAEEALKNSENFLQAIKYAKNNFTPSLPPEAFSVPNECITELKIFDTADLVPADFHVVKCIENFKNIDLTLPNRKILGYKKDTIVKDFKGLVGFYILENSGGESVGDLTVGEADRPNPIFSKIASITPKDRPIRDIIYVKASSIYNVGIPENYELVTDKEGKAINIAPKSEKDYYLFVAIKSNTTVLNTTVWLLEDVKSKGTNNGLSESKKLEIPDKKEENADYSSMSINELYALLQEFEYSRIYKYSETLLSSILNKNPTLIQALSTKFELSKIFSIVDPSVLEKQPGLFLSEDFNEQIWLESLSILISSMISKSGGKNLKILSYESTHPYDNNMDVDDVITIPGARALRIEFDPQCYTESGCDPLRFYENSGRSGELRCLSGQGEASWPNFEVPGDTVYTYFHSDGSVNYWGYKFDVIPVGAGGKSSEDEVDYEIALKILKVVLKNNEAKQLYTQDIFLAPFYMFLLTCSNPSDKAKVLDLLKEILLGQSTTIYQGILKTLIDSASKLYNSTKNDKISHELLQSLIILLYSIKKHHDFKIEESWFLDLSDLLSDMQGFTDKDQSLELFLFESYKSSGINSLEKELESQHPYPISTSNTIVKIEGAHSLNIEFTAESKAEERHTVLFTSDPEGKVDIEAESSHNTVTASWDTKGPDVVVDQDDKRATRTNSSNWGALIANIKFSEGINSITYLIENTGDSGYMYVGFIEADDNNTYELGACLNSDYVKRVWTWRKSGEFHVKGSSFSSTGFETGDLITFVVNSITKTITCLLNNIEIHTFTNVADTLVPAACFGGSNQFLVLKKVDTIGVSSLESKKISFQGDLVHLWFPVNTSARLSYKWDYANDEKGTVSQDKLTVTKLGEGPSLFPTNTPVLWGKHYFQFKLNNTGKAAIGVALTTSITDKNLEDPKSLYYNSDGVLGEQTLETFTQGDVVGCLVEVENNSVSFYKNNNLVTKIDGKLENLEYKFVGVLYEPQDTVVIITERPSNLDLLSINSDLVSTEWGYKIKVSPEFKGRSYSAVKNLLASSTEDFVKGWDVYKSKYLTAFLSSAVEELITYTDQYSASKGKDPLTIAVEEIEPNETELIYYPELEKLPKEDIKKLFTIIQQFNKRIESSLYLFDLNIKDTLTDMQRVLIGSRNYIFFKLKNDTFKKVLDKTKNDIRTEITIDRPKAARHRQRKEVDVEGQFSIFGQIYRSMVAVENKGYRNSERVYKINYRGEASIDAGGPYNESMSNICDELQSSFLKLLVPVQNNVHNMGENRETWIINPEASSELDYELYSFLGKIMGAAIRTQNNLNLSLPPLFWKKLLHETVTVRDLRGTDVCSVQILEILKNPSAHELTPENFEMAYDEKFTTRDSSGREVELFPGGKEKSVTYENCGEYADLVVKLRLNENPKAYSKLREGISASVPLDYLNLFSWKQLETLVCGTVDVDVDILKENTDYEGCGLSDQHIQHFWEILKEFSQKERSLFLKFVWGRSRLPSGKDWKHMKITRYNPNGPVNNFMPVTHTCFFTIDLPAYTNKESMKQKLLYAITHCTAIDLDGSAGAGWEEND